MPGLDVSVSAGSSWRLPYFEPPSPAWDPAIAPAKQSPARGGRRGPPDTSSTKEHIHTLYVLVYTLAVRIAPWEAQRCAHSQHSTDRRRSGHARASDLITRPDQISHRSQISSPW